MKTITLDEVVCCNCGTTFGIDETLNGLREEDGSEFYCPNGHAQSYQDSETAQLVTAQSELKELRKELTETQTENRRMKCEILAMTQRVTPSEPKRKSLLARIFA